MKFVLNGNDLITDITHAIWTKLITKRGTYPYEFEMDDTGFQISRKNLYRGHDLNIKWAYVNEKGNRFMPEYNRNTNTISIPFDIRKIKYNKSYDSVLKVIDQTKRTLIHELKHWHDDIEFDISKNKYTKITQLEMESLKKLEDSAFSFISDPKIDYINQQTEINAYIAEFIDEMLNDAIINEKTYNFDELLVLFNKKLNVPINNLTDDMKKRLYKRLAVFNNSLRNFIHKNTIKKNNDEDDNTTYIPLKDRITDDLKKDLIKTIKEYTGIVESIDYTHQDILNKKDMIFFDVNYTLDEDYKKWFDNKYIINGKCKVKMLENYIEQKNRPAYIPEKPKEFRFDKW
jgi:hypothetical protein